MLYHVVYEEELRCSRETSGDREDKAGIRNQRLPARNGPRRRKKMQIMQMLSMLSSRRPTRADERNRTSYPFKLLQ